MHTWIEQCAVKCTVQHGGDGFSCPCHNSDTSLTLATYLSSNQLNGNSANQALKQVKQTHSRMAWKCGLPNINLCIRKLELLLLPQPQVGMKMANNQTAKPEVLKFLESQNALYSSFSLFEKRT